MLACLATSGCYRRFTALERIAPRCDADGGVPGDGGVLRDAGPGVAGPLVSASRGLGGVPSDGASARPNVSADGRFVTFRSEGRNLLVCDLDPYAGIYVRELATDLLSEVSITFAGEAPNASSERPWLSADGRWVTFITRATNLLPDDANAELFTCILADRETRSLEIIDRASSGAQGDAACELATISADGRWVAFASDSTNLDGGGLVGRTNVFLRDRTTGTTVRLDPEPTDIDPATAESHFPVITPDGRFVVFTTTARAGDGGGAPRVFEVLVFDRVLGTYDRVSRPAAGLPDGDARCVADVSPDGRYVVFASTATNLLGGDPDGMLADAYLRDRTTGALVQLSVPLVEGGTGGGVSLEGLSVSDDGLRAVFASDAGDLVEGDTNGALDVFVRDLRSRRTLRISVPNGGGESDGASLLGYLSGRGDRLVFVSDATNLGPPDGNAVTDVFVASIP